MLRLLGESALSSFRVERLLRELRTIDPRVTGVQADLAYLADVESALQPEALQQLQSLVEAVPCEAFGSGTLLVTPRPGTQSPWSSKATDILHNCGLTAVLRLERAVLYRVAGPGREALGDARIHALLHDPMTESVFEADSDLTGLFLHESPRPLARVTLGGDGHAALREANRLLGLALSDEEIDYLVEYYLRAQRDPTDVELMMFAQANSEHCRHKIFNASWTVDGEPAPKSLFAMIRETHARQPAGVLSAYRDNAAVLEGYHAERFFPHPGDGQYTHQCEPVHLAIKVETHNHPMAISPFPGAATGAGGEIRDEGATGRGARPKAGLVGYSVSHLRIPELPEPWEFPEPEPRRIANSLRIMLEGPIGAAAFNNEFGRPGIYGYFRTFEAQVQGPAGRERRGYHKPIMIAGGVGNVRPAHVAKADVAPGTPLVVLGGPALLIGLGGGAASSVATGTGSEALDFASVQRGNPEMQRRAQEVIDRCWALGEANPVLSIHDVGAGGLSNALPEIIHDAARGGVFELRDIPTGEPGLSPRELWCNEAQERYVLAIAADRLEAFAAMCERERAPFALVGHATAERQLRVLDRLTGETPVDMPMEVLLGKPPRMHRDVRRSRLQGAPLPRDIELEEAVRRVLRFPAVADKTFLVTIGDRTVGGLVCRDPMVGPWQVPVADCAVTASGFLSHTGEAMAMGERTPLALLDPAASGRMAVAEAITNIAAARIDRLQDVKLSANWMAACGHPGEDAALFDTVRSVALDLCTGLGLCIPVGKDSLSMKTVWQEDGTEHSVIAPMSLIVSAFAPVLDVRRTLTPQLRLDRGDSDLVLVDLGRGRNRLGGSVLAQVHGALGTVAPDLDRPADLQALFMAVQALNAAGRLLAYHDRSDGGLLVVLTEMMFAGGCGLHVLLDDLGDDTLAVLFSEEIGAVLQVPARERAAVLACLADFGLGGCSHVIGAPVDGDRLVLRHRGRVVFDAARPDLRREWSAISYRMQSRRDEPTSAAEAWEQVLDASDPGLSARLAFDPAADVAAPWVNSGARPRVAVLREQGVNGQVEMAAAFDRAGFAAVDVHMSDLLAGRVRLADFHGMAACGGFSYGDVLGAGGGWAKSILHHPQVREQFGAFFENPDTFTLGVCNGCQMIARLQELVPGADHWPRFVRNRVEQYEGRLSRVEVLPSPSLFLNAMQGSMIPVVVAHGEGRADFADPDDARRLLDLGRVTLRFVDNHGRVAERYPANPNGSPLGITGLTTRDGRVTIMMPHPERVFRTVQFSWHPDEWGEDGPWLRMFRNARAWLQ